MALESKILTAGTVANKAIKGAFALGMRQLIVQGLNVLGGILLARLLTPSEFGFYAVIFFLLNFLKFFGDAGLAASLVRESKEPCKEDYQAIFTVQQILVVAVAILLWSMAPWIANLYKLTDQDAWLFKLLAVALFLTSFQTIPKARMERHLVFDKLAIVEVGQAITFNFAAVFLAWKGAGPMSVAWGLLLHALVGALLSNLVDPWPMGWRWSWAIVRSRLAFGLPYQGANVINLLKDMVNPVFVVLFAGAAAAGYINWATMVANYPILAVMLLQRIYMPVFSRLMPWPDALNRTLHAVIGLVSVTVYTAGFLLYVFKEQITALIFGSQWQPALDLFLPFTIITVLLTPTIIAFSVLNALGHSGTVFRFSVAWLVATWVLGPLFIFVYGWQGWGWANVCVNLLNLLVLNQLKKKLGFDWVSPVLTALGVALLDAAGGYALVYLGVDWMIALGCSLAMAMVLLYFVYRAVFQELIRRVRSGLQ